MSLPLPVRKNLRDAEPKLKEALEKINGATGKEFSFEADWPSLVTQIDAYYKDKLGDLFYGEILKYLAENISKLCKNETAKEAFIEATSANKITAVINDKQQRYWQIEVKNGEIIVSSKKSIANINELEYFDIIAILPTPGLPLPTKLNIEASQEKLQANLERINAATGNSDWQVEVDFMAVISQIDAYYKDRLGSLYYDDVLSCVAKNWETQLKNEMLKEAFNEATSEHRIEFVINDKQQKYWDIQFKNGAVIYSHKKSIANINELEYLDLAPKIPSPGLPMVTKLNLNQPENLEALQAGLDQLNEATGADDWSFEADWNAIIPQLDQYYRDKPGDLYYREVLKCISNNIKKKLGESETIKEAFNEATSAHKLIIRVNDKQPDYWKIKFENGALVLEHKKSIANISNLEYYNIETVIPVPGLSLVVKLDIEKHRPKLDEALENLAKVTDGDWAAEIDFDAIVPQLDPYSQNNIGNIYYTQVIPCLVTGLTKKLEKETLKEAFIEANSERKIVIKINDKQEKYWIVTFQNGSLILSHKKQIANVSEIEYYNWEEAIPVPGTFSLIAKLNIEEARPKLEENLQRISAATGQEYTLDESCLEAIYPKIEDYYKNKIGSLVFDEILTPLAKNLEKAMKDEMVLEAFNEVATAHQITIRHQNPTKNYWDISLKDGTVVLSFQQIANISNIEYFNLEPLL